MDGSTPGSGKKSPFGNGAGNTSGGRAVANDFLTNPSGAGAKRAPANPIIPQRDQSKLNNEQTLQRNPKDAAPGGNTAAEAVTVPPSRSNDVGVGSPGGRKPFSV